MSSKGSHFHTIQLSQQDVDDIYEFLNDVTGSNRFVNLSKFCLGRKRPKAGVHRLLFKLMTKYSHQPDYINNKINVSLFKL